MPALSNTDSIFARAYANAIKTKFQLEVGQHYRLLTSPVTQRGMAAGDLIYRQMTNYLIYKFADALQYSDNPIYTGGSAGSYIQQLRRGDPSQEAADRMAKARDAAKTADTNYWTVQGEALKQFTQVKDLYPDQTFWQWAADNYPSLDAADRTRKAVQTELYQAMQLYYGPDATTLSTLTDNIGKAQSSNAYLGYNMDGLVEDEDLIDEAIKYANTGVKAPEQPINQSTIRVPAYNMATYTSGVQAWITAAAHGATRDQIVEIDIDEGRKTKWQDFGFEKEALQLHSGGNVEVWPFCSAEVYVNGEKQLRTLKTKGRENDISLQLAMTGIQKYNVQVGEWDIPGIKTLFPNRLQGAPDVLNPKLARIVSILVGYDVELKVQFESSMTEEVNDIYEEVKATGGSMHIMGFNVSAGADGGSTGHVDTKFEDIKWDKVSGSMSLTPTKGQVYPTILAVVTQRFD